MPFILLALLETALRLGGYGFDPHLFKRMTIDGRDFLVQNDEFSFSFFPRETARNPGELRMEAVKPAGTFRIFIFGESAAMGDPEPAYGPGRYLEMQLRQQFPGVKFEVINVAFTAINSHVIEPIARECARRQGDLWIIYMGNNEMVGPFGAATVFGRQAPPLPYVRLATAVQRLRTGQLFTALAQKIQGRDKSAATSWGGMEMFLKNQISPQSPLKKTVYESFQRNLEDIIRAGLGSGAKILVNTVAVNLKDCPPFASLTATNLTPSQRQRFSDLYSAAQEAQAQSNFVAAAGYCAQAATINATCADVEYLWGQCLLAKGDFSGAREHLQEACDDDALPFRADSTINGIIRETAGRFAGDDLALFDAAGALGAVNPSGIAGEETFYEHVHFNFDGGYRLGLAWAQQAARMLGSGVPRSDRPWATQETCEQLLGLSDWNRSLIFEHMLNRMKLPPLSSQANNGQRIARLQSHLQQLKERMNGDDARASRANFDRQIAAAPDDFLLRENYALFLQSIGDKPACIDQWRQVNRLIPQDYMPYYQIGHVLTEEDQMGEREADLRKAVQIHPSLTEGWVELGNTLADEKEYSQALASYAVALRQRPGDAEAVCHAGQVYGMTGRHEEAVQHYREAIRLDPDAWEAHYELGGELDAAGRLDEALAEFAAAARLNPDFSRAHFNYGISLAKHGRFAEARHEFEVTLRLEPTYKNAAESLAKVRQILQDSGKN